MAEDNTMYRRISHPVAVVVGRLALQRVIYPCNITLPRRYAPTKQGKTTIFSWFYKNKLSGACDVNYSRFSFSIHLSMLCVLCYVFEGSQTTTYMEHETLPHYTYFSITW